MATVTVSLPEALADYVEAQRARAMEAHAIMETAIAALPDAHKSEPDAKSALRVAARLLEEAIIALDSSYLRDAAETA